MAKEEHFIFDEHVFHLTKKDLKKYVRWRGSDALELYEESFRRTRSFFEKMREHQYCSQTYQPEENLLRINGKGLENFDITNRPQFLMEDHERFTHIPVEKNGNGFRIIIRGHPQKEILPMSRLGINYSFGVSLLLGKRWSFDDGFTGNPRKVRSYSTGIDKHYFYGSSGKIYFRPHDAFHNQVLEKITGYRDIRTGFYMNGTVYQNGEFLYNGQIDSTGTFPFFIREDPKGKREKINQPRPHQGLKLQLT